MDNNTALAIARDKGHTDIVGILVDNLANLN